MSPEFRHGDEFRLRQERAFFDDDDNTVDEEHEKRTPYPTKNPTPTPSSKPSLRPSQYPTSTPSTPPSTPPTRIPSTSPSQYPSTNPSPGPSVSPSNSPSLPPSLVPSSAPSDGPSLGPSQSPTESPSQSPTSSPSLSPTSSPSLSPTSSPSMDPSNNPSRFPSSTPTSLPSMNPSNGPSRFPSSTPTSFPTADPSSEPTLIPSPTPSISPTISLLPSHVPSSTPTSPPTYIPSLRPSQYFEIYSLHLPTVSIELTFDKVEKTMTYNTANTLLQRAEKHMNSFVREQLEDISLDSRYPNAKRSLNKVFKEIILDTDGGRKRIEVLYREKFGVTVFYSCNAILKDFNTTGFDQSTEKRYVELLQRYQDDAFAPGSTASITFMASLQASSDELLYSVGYVNLKYLNETSANQVENITQEDDDDTFFQRFFRTTLGLIVLIVVVVAFSACIIFAAVRYIRKRTDKNMRVLRSEVWGELQNRDKDPFDLHSTDARGSSTKAASILKTRSQQNDVNDVEDIVEYEEEGDSLVSCSVVSSLWDSRSQKLDAKYFNQSETFDPSSDFQSTPVESALPPASCSSPYGRSVVSGNSKMIENHTSKTNINRDKRKPVSDDEGEKKSIKPMKRTDISKDSFPKTTSAKSTGSSRKSNRTSSDRPSSKPSLSGQFTSRLGSSSVKSKNKLVKLRKAKAPSGNDKLKNNTVRSNIVSHHKREDTATKQVQRPQPILRKRVTSPDVSELTFDQSYLKSVHSPKQASSSHVVHEPEQRMDRDNDSVMLISSNVPGVADAALRDGNYQIRTPERPVYRNFSSENESDSLAEDNSIEMRLNDFDEHYSNGSETYTATTYSQKEGRKICLY